MFWSKDKVSENELARLNREIEELRAKELELKSRVEHLKLEKKTSEEDIKHMVRMKEERQELEYQKRVVELEGKTAKEIEAVKNEYRDKLENELNRQINEAKEMYADLLKRLPDINVKLNGSV